MKIGKFFLIIGVTLVLMQPSPCAQAGWMDILDSVIQPQAKETTGPATNLGSLLGREEMISGLREALLMGFKRAVEGLGKQGGFLDDKQVRISMPSTMVPLETALRMAGQGALAEKFVETMNRAAEKAVPVTATIFAQAIRKMSIADAANILQGQEDAATQFFRKASGEQLTRSIHPIVANATQKVGLTATYKMLTGALSGYSGLLSNVLGSQSLNLDDYVTRKALDGLFLKIAEEEKRIRENPMARSSDLLKKVFGALGS